MKRMTSNEIRKSWIDFFEAKKHYLLEPASLIPNNDPSLLWINSGVATLKKFFSGIENPPSNRLVNYQKAIRTNDIFNVGKTARHQTLFEMLGNFSIGDYFKVEAIEFAFELLTKVWEIDLDRLWFTVFEEDQIAFDTWVKLGVNPERILKCGRDRNFWDVGNGPCGPCTEIHYDRGEKYDFKKLGDRLIKEDIENDRYIEIWNIVFSEFNNNGENVYTELFRKNIDTGAGLERIASISQDAPTNFDTDLFLPIIETIQTFSNSKYNVENFFIKEPHQEKVNFNYRVIADHLRAAVFAINDGCLPSNKDRGYVLRRLIRRAMVCCEKLEINNSKFLEPTVDAIIEVMDLYYPNLKDNKKLILDILEKEYNAFKATLNNGIKYFNETLEELDNKVVDSKIAFELVTTYGFPIELVTELCEEKGIELQLDNFDELMKEHQIISKSTRNATGLEKQNAALLALKVESKFDYNLLTTKSKVVALFDKDFNEVDRVYHKPGYAVFDITPFYATSGGQIHDNGYIKAGIFGKKQIISDVIKAPNFQHLHYCENMNLKLNQNVTLVVNKEDRDIIKAQHSSEHLLHAALKEVISKDIKQEGAFKSVDKITFDFKYHEKLTDEQLRELQNWVNDKIQSAIQADVLFVTLDQAKAMNASAYFEDVYKKINSPLRLIKIGDVSAELCGGTHISNTKDIEKFRIIDYYSKGSGSWRIEATSTQKSIDACLITKYQKYLEEVNAIKLDLINLDAFDADAKGALYTFDKAFDTMDIFEMDRFFGNLKELLVSKRKNKLQEIQQYVVSHYKEIAKNSTEPKKLIILKESTSAESIKQIIDELINEDKTSIFWFIKPNGTNWQFYIATNQAFAKDNNINLNDYVASLKQQAPNTKAGGKPNYVQGGINDTIFEDDLVSILDSFGFKKCA